MNCPNCGKEIVDEEDNFCPKCGKTLVPEDEMQQNLVVVQQLRTDLVLAAAILTIVSTAFSIGLGYVAVYQYVTLVTYYGHAPLEGFLILGILGIIAGAFGLTGGVLMLKRKQLKVAMLGIILLVVSVVGNYLTIQHYQYGFTEIILLSETAILLFAILSGILILSSKSEFN